MSSTPIPIGTLVIGAGPTGLGAAYRLKELGDADFLVVEASQELGGLAASFVDAQGFTWDIGGHVQFSHYKYFDELMEKALGKEGWLHHQRESWVWIRDRFVPYPFQNNIRRLPKEVLWKCLAGLIDLYKQIPTQGQGRLAHFGEWIEATFGRGLAEEFMLPYNFKVWAYPAEEMDYGWVGERVAVTDLKRVLENVLFEKDDLSWGPNNTFQFPVRGGTGAIWRRVGELVGLEKIALGVAVKQVNATRREAVLSDGRIVRFQNLLSTIPLDLFLPMIEESTPEARAVAARLKYSSSHIVGIGLKGAPAPELKTKCWMYFPESNCPFYRVTLFSNYSPNNVPDISRHWSLMAETSESSHKKVDPSRLIEETIEGMLATKLIQSRDEIISTWQFTAAHGYPTPFLGRDAMIETLFAELDRLGLYSRGRFGAWKYEVSNQDHSLMQGVEWANRIRLGAEETTVFFPNVVNAKPSR